MALAPWRIILRDMGANRGPGDIVGVLEDMHAPGVRVPYNNGGEVHFTLPKDHPQLSVVQPKLTHYALEFLINGVYVEKDGMAGVVWDSNSNGQDIVFTGISYLALFGVIYDERYDPDNPDLPAAAGGSKYVEERIDFIIADQVTRAIGLTNSPVGFIALGSIATMDEEVTIWSTLKSVLEFTGGLIDSHRQGTGVRTRMRVTKIAGVYTFVVDGTPGIDRDALRMTYGELVQSYQVVKFGQGWANRVHSIGRTRDGIKAFYETATTPGLPEALYGRIATPVLFEDIADANDLIRRTKQAAIESGAVNRNVALALKTGLMLPLDRFDVTDSIPVQIVDSGVNVDGYYTVWAVEWEGYDGGRYETVLAMLPKQEESAADPGVGGPGVIIAPPDEWTIGTGAPGGSVTSRYYYDQATGDIYTRQDDGTYLLTSSGGIAAAKAPNDAGYLVTAAHADLSAEVVVGATPGGELGGTWAAPTVDATHSGSSHAGVIATHEAAGNPHPGYATDGDLAAHAAAGDPHTGYRLESVDHSHETSGAGGGQIDHNAALTNIGPDDHHARSHDHSNASDGTTVRPTAIELSAEVTLTTAGSPRFARLSDALAMDGVESPAQITADQNNYAPGANARAAHLWRLSSDATPRTITGISNAQTHGERHVLANINGSTNMTLAHQSASSTDVNRIICPGAANLTLRAGGAVEIIYDGTTQRWRVVAP